MTRALVVDDEPAICRSFETLLGKLGCDVTVTASAELGVELAESDPFDVIVLDVRLPGMNGLDALPRFREIADVPILVITAHGDLSTAVSSIESGAFDYLPKPFDLDAVTAVLERAIAASLGSRSADDGSTTTDTSTRMVGNSPPMQHLFRRVALAAQHDEPVLITGESGVGKELVAQAIHQHSSRGAHAIVPIHLASLTEALMERELFGHTAGAYTGATDSQDGLIARADGGTLFLDEIGETPRSVQVKLLRTIETREFYRVGSSESESSDFRLIAATNRPIDYLRSSEEFRADLFYRLSTIHIHVPPLRERQTDIPLLADYILTQDPSHAERELSAPAVQKLQQYHFPGNVRELKNIVLRAAAESSEQSISADFVSIVESPQAEQPTSETELDGSVREWAERAIAAGQQSLFASATAIVERELIAVAMKHCADNRSAAAALLGIHRETLRDKLGKYEEQESR